jgi:tetratricopeptide (TPR) repeat protein
VDLDPTLADAHSALAAAWQGQWRWQEADAEISRAIELDPRYPVAYFRKAFNLAILRRFPEAEKALASARELDPAWDAPNGLLCELYYYERRYNDALTLARRWRETNPLFFDSLSARVYVELGRMDAVKPMLSAKTSDPFAAAALRAIGGDGRGAFEELLSINKSSGLGSFHMAEFAVFWLHDKTAAIDWLERALRDHEPDVVSLRLDPIFDPIRQDKRAVAILRELNLAQ